MKILFVHERFGAMAGAEVNVLLTATGLKHRGHTPGLIHGSATGKGEDPWRETFSQCVALQPGNNAPLVKSALEQFRPDVIYVHKMADLEVIETLVKSGRPLVRMVHDHDLYCMRSYKYNPLTRNICSRAASLYCVFPCGATIARQSGGGWPFRWASYTAKKRELELNRRFHRLVVATAYMREELLNNHFDARTIEIHPPVPRAMEDAMPGSFSARNLIIYSGQIVRGKGVDVLLESLAQVGIQFECVILGDGNHRPFCEALSRKLGLDDRVRFAGFIPQNQLQDYYRDASVAVMSSVWPEPFGAAGLEAMRHGLPVVAFDAGGIKEWLLDGHNGFLVPWMDRATFAARIEQLLRDKALARQMGERGGQFVREKYSFEQYLGNLERMFVEVAREMPSPACA